MRLVLLVLLLLPSIAYAGEVVIFGLVVSVFTIVQVVLLVGSYIYGAAQKRKARRKARDEYNANLQDRSVTAVATEAPHVYVYGEARVGSNVVAILTSGARDEFKHLVCVHAAHECESFEEIYVQGKALGTLDADGFVTSGDYYSTRTDFSTEATFSGTIALAHTPIAGTVTAVDNSDASQVQQVTVVSVVGNVVTIDNPSGTVNVHVSYQYTTALPRVRVKKHLGTPTDPVDAYLNGLLPTQWPATSVLRGFCYTVITLDLNQPEFQGGIPDIQVLLKGKKLYDPRTGLTVWSSNPALAIYDYLVSEICGVPTADIPTAELITAANVCDEVDAANPAGGVRYTFNGTVTSDQDQKPVLEKMEEAMAGIIVPTTWEISAGKYVAPVMALYQEDIVGAHGSTPGAADADIYNGVRGQFISSENNYVATDFAPFQNATYVTTDDRELWHNNDFPFTDSVQRVHNLCRIMTEDQRNGFTLKAVFSQKAWALRVGQRVTFTSAFYGQAAKIYRVTDKKFSPDSMVDLVLKEDSPDIWDFADAVTADSTPNSNLQNPFDIDPLTSLTCSSGTDQLLIGQDGTIISRILAVWPVTSTQAVFTQGLIEVEWQKIGSDVINKAQVSGSETQAHLSPVLDGGVYIVRARTVNPYLNVKSDWTYAAAHQVIGKTEPPPDVMEFSIAGSILNWAPVTAVDLNGYIFRFHYGNNTDWGTAVPLHEGVIVSSPFDLVTRPSGTVTIMAKALDTSGNESLATANVITDLGDAPIANVVETITFDPTFPGTYSGCSVVGGDLVASALDSFYGTDTQSFYDLSTLPLYEAGSFGEMVYTTNEIPIGTALAGSVMTLLSTSQGTDIFIEYRRSGPGSWYGADSDSWFGPDDDPFYGGPGPWIPWPGQIVVDNDIYEFRFTIGAGLTQGKLFTASLVIDAPTIVEYVNDLVVAAAGTAIPYTSAFTVIRNIQVTLQANASGAETVEVNKTSPLAPSAKTYNSAHVAVSGATIDVTLKGY